MKTPELIPPAASFIMKKTLAAVCFFFIIIITVLIFNTKDKDAPSSCASCHEGIEEVSENHKMICTDCHGGDDNATLAENAHKDMVGGKNPASPAHWEKTCGGCHEYQLKRVQSTIMLTNTGIIKNTLAAWGEESDPLYSQDSLYRPMGGDGKPIDIKTVKDLDNIPADMYRKFCSSCHVGKETDMGYTGTHSSGCSACHFPYGEFGEYNGNDPQMKGREFYPSSHAMEKLPTDAVCAVCHSRSGRISLSYSGLYDGNNALVPTRDGIPGPELTSGVRNMRHMKADIHFQRGMECIDCHTSMEIMGDGYYYGNMYEQAEVSCESCHGSPETIPAVLPADRENLAPLIESKNYKKPIPFGTEMVLTEKGRMYSNVYKKDGGFVLMSKRSGTERPIKIITGTEEHKIEGHGRLACYTCHSSAVIQCYGCHVEYDERQMMHDYIKEEDTPGLFTETEDLRTFYPFPLAVDQRGKITPATPGCQTFLTHIDGEGNVVKKGFVLEFRGAKKLKFAPFFGHNVGEKAITCAGCHADPMFYGFGDGLFSYESKTFTAPVICDECDIPLLPLYHIDNGSFEITSDVVREGSRVLNRKEIINMINAGKCIICHDKGEIKYYGGRIDYDKVLNDTIHKPLLD